MKQRRSEEDSRDTSNGCRQLALARSRAAHTRYIQVAQERSSAILL